MFTSKTSLPLAREMTEKNQQRAATAAAAVTEDGKITIHKTTAAAWHGRATRPTSIKLEPRMEGEKDKLTLYHSSTNKLGGQRGKNDYKYI